MRKQACVIAAGEWSGSRCLVKNRDRNYKPNLRLVHTVINGVEVVYMEDLDTGWIEGINEYGIGVVNSALLVGHDEAEKKLVKTRGRKSKDGARTLKALSKRTLDAALKSLQAYQGGIKGHTVVSDAKTGYSLEMTSKHTCVTKPLPENRIHVRTNHGIEYDDAGYTDGADYISSLVRRETAQNALESAEKTGDLAPALMGCRKKDRKHPNNVVRDTDNMFTSSQIVLNLTDLQFNLYLIEGKQTYKGLETTSSPEGKIKIKVFSYDKDGNPKTRKAAERVALVHSILYGA